MKRTILIFSAAIFLAPSMARSMPVGGPIESIGDKKFGMSADFGYFNKRVATGTDRSTWDDFSSVRVLAKPTFAPVRQVELSLLAGLSDIRGSGTNFQTPLRFSYGGAVKLFLLDPEENKVSLGFAGSFLTQQPGKTSDTTKDAILNDEYQAGIFFLNHTENSYQYGGVKYSGIDVKYSDPGDGTEKKNYNFHARVPVGFFIGIDYHVNPNIFFMGELQIFDQEALYVGVGFKF